MRIFVRVYTPRSDPTDSHSYIVGSYQGGLSSRIGSLSINVTEMTLHEMRSMIQEDNMNGMVKRNPMFTEYLNIFHESSHEWGLDKIEYTETLNSESEGSETLKGDGSSSETKNEKNKEGKSQAGRKLKARDSSYCFGIVGKDEQFPQVIDINQENVPVADVFNPIFYDLALIPTLFLEKRKMNEDKITCKNEKAIDTKVITDEIIHDDIIYGSMNETPSKTE